MGCSEGIGFGLYVGDPEDLGSMQGALIVVFVGFSAAAVLASQQAAAVAASVINPFAPKWGVSPHQVGWVHPPSGDTSLIVNGIQEMFMPHFLS